MRLFEEYFKHRSRALRQEWAETAHFVDVTEVARCFYEDTAWYLYDAVKDFPSLALPWVSAWMEYEQPDRLFRGSQMHPNPLAGRRAAAMLRCLPLDDGETSFRIDIMGHIIAADYLPRAGNDFEVHIRTEMASRRAALEDLLAAGRLPRWLLCATMLQDFPGEGLGGWGSQYLYLDEYGKAFGDLRWTVGWNHCGPDRDVQFTPIAFAISLLHCKNVHLEAAPAAPRLQCSRKQRRKPALRFETLVVDPLHRQVRRSPAEEPGDPAGQVTRGLHIARGHFKDYREGGGLFGRLHGLYWWDMHVRGSAAAGAVIKDYRVRPGSGPAERDA